jgi:hypothetical protein
MGRQRLMEPRPIQTQILRVLLKRNYAINFSPSFGLFDLSNLAN